VNSAADSVFHQDDRAWMLEALRLAELGVGKVEPNPAVGCVLVSQGKLIGSGFHARYGEAHAERVAIGQAKLLGNETRLSGCTAYVTLEPCCHHGKTPPCTDALLDIGASRVVVATQDPFAAVSGKGISLLRSAGIQVDVGLEAEAALQLNAPYFKRLATGLPWVIAKWAMSLDGRIASSTGNSQWISSETSRQWVHRLRGRVDAILVGRGTAQADDPLLTARLPADQPPCRTALRVVIDSRLSLPVSSRLVQTAAQFPTLIWTTPLADLNRAQALRRAGCRVESSLSTQPSDNLQQLLQFLVQEYCTTNLLVEGGGQLLGSLFDLRQIDQCEVFIAPKLIGGANAVSPLAGVGVSTIPSGPECHAVQFRASDTDVHYSCRLRWPNRMLAHLRLMN
jgi:diaminohydroxyphosphoribosylaminopyrimidine deaminase/5-amino-6-(5-phosphoribosylamino)uracil reductase